MHTVSPRPWFILAVCLILSQSTGLCAQSTRSEKDVPKPAAPTRTIEDLNYQGGDAAMPLFSDSRIAADSPFRRGLLHEGMTLRVITQAQYAQNTLAAPVAADEQTYVGQRAFEGAMAQPIFTADLHQLHLRQTELYAGGVWKWVSWNPAGPKALQLWDLYLYKAFGEDRVQMKAGYVSNNLDFVGFFVGGSTSAGALGVYTVLPYEVGMSFFPLTSPSLNMRIRGPKNTYFRTAAQRSLDPRGGPTEVARNHTGFRFAPHGDKLLSINEGGYLRRSSSSARQLWLRAGYMYNFTAYKDVVSGKDATGNYCVYVLMDGQLTQSDRDHPNRGWYIGASAEAAPAAMNPYARYDEARVYKEAPFRRRPSDVAALIVSRTGYSQDFTNPLVQQGKTVSRAAATVTGSYTMRVAAGEYLGVGLGYIHGPAITPRVPSALTFNTNWSFYF